MFWITDFFAALHETVLIGAGVLLDFLGVSVNVSESLLWMVALAFAAFAFLG